MGRGKGKRRRKVSLESRVLREELEWARFSRILAEAEFIEKKVAVELSKKRDPREYVV